MSMVVSVIVPVYNAEKYLRRCVDSILVQTFTDFELLLIDDGSADGSSAICDEYAENDNRVHVFHKPNGGVSSARNLGLNHARGEWVTFVDADDWIDITFLWKMLEKAKSDKADVVMCDFTFCFPVSERVLKTYDWNEQGLAGLSEFISTVWTCLCGTIQKKRIYDDNHFQSPQGISYCEDFHLIVRLCSKAKKIVKVNKPLYYYRQQLESTTHNLGKKTEIDERWVYSDIINYFESEGIYEELKKAMAWRLLKASQELALDSATFNQFKNYNSDKNCYIFSCPFIGIKLKVIMWCIAHNLAFLAVGLVKIRGMIRK